MACRDGCGCPQETRDARTDEWVGAGMPPSASMGRPVARLQAEKAPAEVQGPDGRSEAVSRLAAIRARLDAATPGPWSHAGMLWLIEEVERLRNAIAEHRFQAARLDAAEAERDDLAAKVRNLADWHETKADKARRFRPEVNGENQVMDKAASVHGDAAQRLRAALADPDGGDRG